MPAETTWGIGDYPRMARRLEPAAAALVELAAVGPADTVLDLACGSGNAALLAAARGASVLGVDLEPRLLEVAAERARRAAAEVDWRRADIGDLELGERRFSAVLSAFGAMYAPDHEATAKLLAAACETGGRVALAAWTPGSLMPAMGAVLAPYLPPPPPSGSPPSRWGDAAAVGALLDGRGLDLVEFRERTVELRFGDRPEAVDFLIDTAGNLLAERDRIVAEGRWQALEGDLMTLVAERDEGGADGVLLPCDYLLVLAIRQG